MRTSQANRQGFTLLELMLSVGISASLLTAVAMAFNASADAVASNSAYAKCLQTSRTTLDLIATDVRRADAVRLTATGDGVDVLRHMDESAPSELFRRFRFDPQSQTLNLQIFTLGNSYTPEREIADHITACQFTLGDHGRLSIHLSCSEKSASVTLDDAVAPRRLGKR